MYAACTDAVGGRMVTVPPRPDFCLSPRGEAATPSRPRTGLVYLDQPEQPDRARHPRDAIAAPRRQRCRPARSLFLDEAYVEFGRETIAGDSTAIPNLVIGRTFAKAQGLAAVRAGAVVGAART